MGVKGALGGILALGLVAIPSTCAAATEDSVSQFVPAGAWTANFADDSCALERSFARGDDTLFLRLRQYTPGDRFEITLASETMSVRAREPRITFAPTADAQEIAFYQEFRIPRGLRGLIFSVAPLGDRPADSPLKTSDFTVYADARPIDRLVIERLFTRNITVLTGSLEQPLKIMEACLDDLMTMWGLDPRAHHGLSRRVTEKDGQAWPGWIGGTRMGRLIGRWPSDRLPFRLLIDEAGRVIGCDLVSADENADLAEEICAAAPHYEFLPALDAEGRPIKSYHENVITKVRRIGQAG